jgi:SecD/SecF fusion protein
MTNRKGIIILTIIFSALCIWSLSFTWISRNIQKDASEQAMNAQGQVDLNKKQKYMDSIYQEPVFNFLGLEYTYKEIKENELGLGLDLQGGMHVVLEVSPVEILKALAGPQSSDPQFVQAIKLAQEKQKTSKAKFTDLFYESYSEINPGRGLTGVFNNTQTAKYGILSSSTDNDIKKMIETQVEESVKRTENIIRTRIDKFGVVSPNVQRLAGSGRIQLELPGVENPQRVRNLLQGVAQMEFLEVYFYREIDPYLSKMNDYLLTIEKPKKAVDSTSTSTDSTTTTSNSLFEKDSTSAKLDSLSMAKADSTRRMDSLQANISSFFKLRKQGFSYDIKDTAKINAILAMPKIKSILPSQMRFYWEKKDPNKKKEGEPMLVELIPVKKERAGNVLTGESVVKAGVDSDPSKGVVVSMTMDDAGARKWRTITQKASSETEYPGGPKRRIAIVLDEVVYSAPTVDNEIPNGQSIITGNFSIEDANDLATILEAGKLPTPVRIVEEMTIGPSLGKEAIGQGLNSMLVGLGLVIIFMIFYYAKGGLVADVALFFNILFILGAMASINSVLTLPGIAGMVLTIGMAVDANVLIFERIREELSLGKPLHTAINLGYEKAFSSIFDSNVTTILTGAILAYLGSGPVKGFAVTLIIGLICSFFTSVYISKVIVLWLSRNKEANSVTFSTVISRNMFKNFNFDFIGKRKIAYFISGSLLIFGFVTMFMQGGLNLGVDFAGGRSYIVQFDEPVIASDLKQQLSDQFEGTGVEAKAYGSNYKMKITTSYLIDDESKDADHKVESLLKAGLTKFKGDKFEIQSTNKVGGTVADDIASDSMYAIVLSLIGIFLYVLVRFKKWQFSMGGVVAIFHDALMVICMFSILRLFGIPYEVDQVFVAAILTIVGFSINDTVIVFDRVREFMHDNPKVPLAKVLNDAINHTLSRTIITTLTVLFVVLILLVFGGEALRGFSLAMVIGVIFGSYSTIFIAVPMVLDIRSKKDIENDAILINNSTKKVTA